MAEKEIGKVIHYFDKLSVAVVKLSGSLKAGDTVKVVKGENDFTMKVASMQIDHESVKTGKTGDEIAIKLENPTKQGAVVYKVTE